MPDSKTQEVLASAALNILRPLVRILLRHSIPFAAFEELAKHAYISVALEHFSIPGKKPSISRASILTGLTRKDVQRLRAEPGAGIGEVAQRYNRAARVLTGWIRDPEFLDAKGRPKRLMLEGDIGFEALVRRHSGDMPMRAVLDELLRVGAVRLGADGSVEPLTRAYVPHRSVTDKLQILGSDVAELIETIDHNLEHGAADARFQRKVMYRGVPASRLAAFRKLASTQAQALLERLDKWLAANCDDDAVDEAHESSVGMGIYYFQSRLDPAASARGPE